MAKRMQVVPINVEQRKNVILCLKYVYRKTMSKKIKERKKWEVTLVESIMSIS